MAATAATSVGKIYRRWGYIGDISGIFSKIGCQNRTVIYIFSCLKSHLNKTIYA